MHPGPINRGVEIAPDVADAANSRIVDQVRAGLVTRMAVLYDLLSEPTSGGGEAALRVVASRRTGGGLMTERLFRRSGEGTSLLIEGARLVDSGSGLEGVPADVLIERRRSSPASAADIDASGVERFDAAGMTMTPGLVDPHVHLRTPGDEDEEDVGSGTRAAAAGGFVAILAMPNTQPVVDSAPVLSGLIELARDQAVVPTGFMAAITLGQEGRQLSEMAELAGRGAAAFSDDGHPVAARRPAAAGAAVQPRHGPAAVAPRGGSQPDRRLAHARGRRSRPSSG